MSDCGSVFSSSSGKGGSRKYSTFEDWCDQNPSLSQFLEALIFRNKISVSQFMAKRQGTHNRCTDSILAFIKKLENETNHVQEEIARFSQLPYPQIEFIGYDNNQQNEAARKLAFIGRSIHLKQIDVLSKKFGVLTDAINNNKSMLRLFTSDWIPKNKIYRIKETFFNVNFGDSIATEERHILMMKSYEKKLKAEINNYQKPLWHKNFAQFMIDISQKGLSHMDLEISYFYSLEDEVALSRALFSNSSKQRSQIDEYLRSSLRNDDPNEYVMGIMDICEDIIPEQIENHDQQSVCILVLFRALFNRIYERFSSEFAPKPTNEIIKVEKLKKIPSQLFTIPTELVGSQPHGPISDFFKGDPFFLAAAQFLSQSIFMSNPIDMLYCIHKCLIGIQKGALIHRIGPNTNAKMEDVKTLLCFDDLFSLFVGTLMASDIPDIFFVSDFISKYSPKESLSPPFEYALANTEALVAHCRKLDLDELNKKAEEFSK